jgi:hypothetical protein
MKWKRGLLLAWLNLVAALPMIALLELRDARSAAAIKREGVESLAKVELRRHGKKRSGAPRFLRVQEEANETVTFDPCTMNWVHYSTQEEVVRIVSVPASTLAGWRLVCWPKWTLSEVLLGPPKSFRWNPAAQRRVDAGLCVLIAIQWILVGAFPLTKMRKLWGEPGAFITICAGLFVDVDFGASQVRTRGPGAPNRRES